MSPQPLSERGMKRVNFSPLTSYIRTPDISSSLAKTRCHLRSLRPSKQCKPAKSILKTSASVEPSDEPRSSPTDDLPGMVDSILHQLAGDCRVSRTDAYMQLLGSLATYSDLPETEVLAGKMDLLTQYIRRDVTAGSSNTFQPFEVSLAHQASNLLCWLIWKPEFTRYISDEFKSFVLDLAIGSLQDPSTPKTIVIDDLRILSVQTFHPKILTSGKVTLLLQTLKDITSRFNGKSVIAIRLAIYDKLLKQAPSVLAPHANLWMDHLIQGMVNKVKDIRSRALTLGFEISKRLGVNSSISKAIHNIFDLTIESGAKYIDELCARLTAMVTNRDGSVFVPQIWSVIVLLLRKPRYALNAWSHFKQWILVIQKCFNCSDCATKIQAFVAWDCLVYAIQTSDPWKDMTSFLSKPIFLQLERRRDESSTPLVDRAVSSYCNLLYYSFRPSTPYERLDSYWNEYICLPFQQRLGSNGSNQRIACTILAELLWNSHPKVSGERSPIKAEKLKPDDLLRVDCRWVRSRISVILPVFESFFQKAEWSNDAVEESPVELAWTHMLKSLADASSKEIQPSPESMKAIALLLDMLQRVWKGSPASLNANPESNGDLFVKRFCFLLKSMISIIKPLPFTDKLLLKTMQETFLPAQTPTRRQPQKEGIIRSPILHLFGLILSPSHSPISTEYRHLIAELIRLGVSGHPSRGPRLDILCQFTEILCETRTGTIEFVPSLMHEAWKSISSAARECLKERAIGTPSKERDDTIISDCNKIVSILEFGSQFQNTLPEWVELFDSMVATIRTEKGDVAVSSVLERVSESCSRTSSVSVQLITKLLETIVFPNHGIKRLPQFTNAIPSLNQQPTNEVFCEKLLALVCDSLQHVYAKQAGISNTDILALLEAVTRCLEKSPPDYRLLVLEKLQNGLAVWISDSQGQYSASSADKRVPIAVRTLVSTTLRNLRGSGDPNSDLLQRLTGLISSGI
ncbi:predicted protein [Uncinocarpus reesii 1704]|uniref:Telomere-associated protein Rif1 N-terminal domain-containing protein n=1 Tax=Uncinocarpus reesii (strain UAMH 1704) TaxID=336963 RepID=C4JG90_UNCRE|nr:uncharacterized protein UREG_02488 [Uncinocarpus reesii 1704]EEP77639.1 predicted protein [Uncinocarpus reesii 1704]